jgi:hypothetical protein
MKDRSTEPRNFGARGRLRKKSKFNQPVAHQGQWRGTRDTAAIRATEASGTGAPKLRSFDHKILVKEPIKPVVPITQFPLGPELLLSVETEGRSHKLLIDSGASLSSIKEGISDARRRTDSTAQRITGARLRIYRTQEIAVTLRGENLDTRIFSIAVTNRL